MSSYARREPGSLREATDQLIDAAGGQSKVADLFSWPRQYLHRYATEGESSGNQTIPTGLVRLIETHVGDPIVTRFLAAEQGCVLLPLPTGAAAQRLAVDLQAIGKQFADLIVEYGRALDEEGSGGSTVTTHEAGRLVAEMHDVLEAIAGPLGRMMAIRDGEKP